MSESTVHPLEAILRVCAQAAPAPWFPKVHTEMTGASADHLLLLLEHLWLEGLIEKTGSSPETGPGFTLTDEGRRVLQDPALLAKLRVGSVRPEGDRGATVREAIRNPTRPVVSRALLAANLLVFAYGVYLASPNQAVVQAFLSGPWGGQPLAPMQRVLEILHQTGALRGDDLVRHEWWRLLSTGFVHIGLMHLGMNMYALYVLGWQVEAMWGHWRFLVVYLAGLLGGSCAMVAAHPATLGAGASGALCGLLGSEAVWLFLNRRYFPWGLVARWRRGLTTTLVLMVVISLVPGVSGWAHLGGALAGGAASWLLNSQRFGRPPWSWLALASLVPVFAAGPLAVDWAWTTQRDWQSVERRDFLERQLQPAVRAAQAADKVYNNVVVELLMQPAGQRDAKATIDAVKSLAEQIHNLRTSRKSVSETGPYRQAALVEENRLALLAALEAHISAFEDALKCLQSGDKCTAEEKRHLQEAVGQAERRWQIVMRGIRE